MAVLPAIAAIATAAGGMASSMMKKDKSPDMPTMPDPGAAEAKARQDEMRRRRMRTKTLLTSPQGAMGEAQVGKKTLLGE